MSDSTPSHPKPEPETPRPAAEQAATVDAPMAGSDPTPPSHPDPTEPAEPGQPDAPSHPDPTEPSNPSAPEPTSPTDPTPPPAPPTGPTAPPVPPMVPGAQASTAGGPAQKRNGNIGVIAALAVGALVGGVSGAGVYAVATNNANDSVVQTPASTNITVNDPGNATTVTAVAASAAQSVVTIAVQGDGASGSGSGVFLSDDGYVLTNAHVATLSGATADPAVTVQTSDGLLYEATLVGSDPIADLAVVKVDAENVEFQPATFADSSELNVGDMVVALGAPLGLANTVTSGIISALNRSIEVASSAVPETEETPAPEDNGDNNGPFDFWEFDNDEAERPAPTARIALPVIQTDAAINPGNSGGALLDSDGNVIGINVAIASAGGSQAASGNIGLGFAIPSNLAQRIADELIEDGQASHGLLGANVLSVTDDAETTGATTVGSVIKAITPGGAAEKAGLRVGDIVTEFNGMRITSSTDLTAQVRVLPGGAEAELVYVRGDDTETVTVTLGEL